MKLIIDIPKQCFDFINTYGIQDTYQIEQIIGNGTPLAEELKKIQHEIGNEFVDLQDGSEEWRSYVNDAVLSCYEIVDKYIMDSKEEPFGETTSSKGVLEQIAEEQKTLSESTKAWSNYIDKNGNIY